MAPSTEIGDDAAVIHPAHDSAPDIAGQDIAIPVGIILSTAPFLDTCRYLFGEAHQCLTPFLPNLDQSHEI